MQDRQPVFPPKPLSPRAMVQDAQARILTARHMRHKQHTTAPPGPLAAEAISAYTHASPMPSLSLHTPLGPMTLSQEADAVVALDWGWGRDQTPTSLLSRAAEQLHAYFDGTLRVFDLPLAAAGSAYRQRVWAALCRVGYGQTCSYATLARLAGGSPRSIGGANGANPIPIIIPCHRVVGLAGLGGYSGGEGVQTKAWLLAHEGAVSPSQALRKRPVCPELMDFP